MKKNKLDEKGLTLIEVLASLLLTVVIALFAYSFITNSFETHKKIMIENSVRDEADLIMSHFVKTIYTLKESEVRKLEIDSTTNKYLIYTSKNESSCSNPSSLDFKNNCFITGFTKADHQDQKQMKLLIQSEEYVISNPYIAIHSDSTLTNSTSANKKVSYHVNLALEYNNNKFSKVYYFENQVQSIPDAKKQ